MSSVKLLCYNKGCGKTFDPNDNKEDSCRFHTGDPIFHDAYKSWSCCKKKCTDFTEFLNIKGCTNSYHSNVKPPEPEKPKNDTITEDVIEVKPLVAPQMERPPFNTPLVEIKPNVVESLKKQVYSLKISNGDKDEGTEGNVTIGTTCKNNSCKAVYEGPQSDLTSCLFHPGAPIFHEGLKYWTCCTKRTTDFETFLSQVGCATGKHVWIKKKVAGASDVKCRTDWHQTERFVVCTVFGKKADPDNSTFEVNPIRLRFSLFFPEQGGAFEKDVELQRIIDPSDCKVTMFPTKVEIQMKKKELGSWSKFERIRELSTKNENKDDDNENECASQVESVDLSII